MPRETARQRQYERSANRKMESQSLPLTGRFSSKKKELPKLRHPLLQRRMYHEMILDPFHCKTPVVNPCVFGPPALPCVSHDYYDWVISKPCSESKPTGDNSIFQRAVVYVPQYPYSHSVWGTFCKNTTAAVEDEPASVRIQESFNEFSANVSCERHNSTIATEVSALDGTSFLARTNVAGIRISALGAPATQTGTLHVYRPRTRIALDRMANSQKNLFDDEIDIERLVSIPISKLGKDGPATFVVRPKTLDDMQLKGWDDRGQGEGDQTDLRDLNTGYREDVQRGYHELAAGAIYLYVERAQSPNTVLPDDTNEVLRVEYIVFYDYVPGVPTGGIEIGQRNKAYALETSLHDPAAAHGPQLANQHEDVHMRDPNAPLEKGGVVGPVKQEIIDHGQAPKGIN